MIEKDSRPNENCIYCGKYIHSSQRQRKGQVGHTQCILARGPDLIVTIGDRFHAEIYTELCAPSKVNTFLNRVGKLIKEEEKARSQQSTQNK